MKDIQTREDVLLIMREFYKKLLDDEKMSVFFTVATDVSQHLDNHFEILADFWMQSLFLTGNYQNNMFLLHKKVHEKFSFRKEHYDTWLSYLYSSIDQNFKGKKAEQMKTQALSIATILKIKLV